MVPLVLGHKACEEREMTECHQCRMTFRMAPQRGEVTRCTECGRKFWHVGHQSGDQKHAAVGIDPAWKEEVG